MRTSIIILCLICTSLSVCAQNAISEDDIPFEKVEVVPYYDSCGGFLYPNQCLDFEINQHLKKKLNVDLLLDLGASPGRKKISSQIRITKTGTTEIIGTKAPYPRFAKEVDRVLRFFSEVPPGKQNGKPVNVIYMCTIVIDVTENSAEVVDYFDLN